MVFLFRGRGKSVPSDWPGHFPRYYQLEKGGFRTVISKAVFAAYQKSRLLGEEDT
jgi:hypothetical protein